MNSCLWLLGFSALFASTFAIKCFVCTSLELDKDAKDDYKKAPSYRVRTCQKPDSGNCTGADVDASTGTGIDITFTIADYYKGKDCGPLLNGKTLNTTGSKNIVECKVGCVKLTSVVTDRGNDLTRTSRQCAFFDKDVVGKYIDTPAFKRTGAGSDKVANWFQYCSSDYCNAASGLSRLSAVMIASFYGILAFLYH